MAWWGKLLGGAFGYMLGGPLGAMLGATLGHSFDRGLKQLTVDGPAPADRERIQTAFFTATFSVMGHLAKVDGAIGDFTSQAVGRSNDLPRLKPTAGDKPTTDPRPVITSSIFVDLRRTAKLSPGDDSHIFVETSLIEIFDER